MNNRTVDRCDYNVGEYINNRYRVSQTLGEGSFGKVYRVTDSASKDYALKLLRLWEVPPEIRKPLMERFEMEFKTGQIDCDYLVRSLDYGTVGGNPYIVMEYCSGGDLTPYLAYIIHSGFISGYQNRYGDNLKPPTNVYHRMTA